MASHAIDLNRKEAGSEYLKSLERLGLRPEALFWAFDKNIDLFVLVLVTDAYDYAGPLSLSKTLLEAYRKAATPREIDPFIVRLHSPKHSIIQEIGRFFPVDVKGAIVRSGDETAKIDDVTLATSDLEISNHWVYRFEKKNRSKTVDAARHWKRFAHNIEKMAA